MNLTEYFMGRCKTVSRKPSMFYAELDHGYRCQSGTLEGIANQIADFGVDVIRVYTDTGRGASPCIPAEDLAQQIFDGEFTEKDLG